MSAQPIERLDHLEALDFNHSPQCEHSQHDAEPRWHEGDAWALIRNVCPKCGDTATLYICQKAWTVKGLPDERLRHVPCGWRGHRIEAWTILALIGDAT